MTTFFTSRLIRQRRKRPRPWIAGSRRLVNKVLIADPAGGVAAWTPASLGSALKGWWKADADVYSDAGGTLATNGQTVQQWNDQSGNGNHLSQATTGGRPTYNTGVQNGLPGLTGSSSSLWRANFALGATSACSCFAVVKANSTPNNSRIVSYQLGSVDYDNVSSFLFNYFSSTQIGTYRNFSTLSVGTITNNVFTQVGTIFDNTNDTTYINNTAQTAVASSGAFTATSDKLTLFAWNGEGPVDPLNGTILEVIVTNSALTLSERNSLNNYFANKWNVGTASGAAAGYTLVAPATPVTLIKAANKRVDATTAATYGPVTPGVAVILQRKLPLVASPPAAPYLLTGTDAALTKGSTLVNKTLDATTPASYAVVAPATPVLLRRGLAAVVASPGATYTVTPGVTVNLKHGFKVIVASPGATYVVTGQDATLTKLALKKLDAAPGVYGPLSGAATTSVLVKRKLDATVPVTYTVVSAAQPAVLKHGWKVVVASPGATYALVPAATTNTLRQRKIDATTAATYGPLAGQAVTLTKGKGLIAAPLAVPYVLVPGATPAVLRINMPLIAGTPGVPYLLTGTAQTLTYRRKIIPTPAGVYGYTGSDVAMIRPTEKILIAGIASYLLVGTNTPILVKRKLDATSVPQYLLTGQIATLTYRRTVSALTPGVYGPLAGASTTNLRHGWRIDALAKTPAYLLTGTAQTLTYRRKVIPTPAGVYGPLGGQAASLRINMPLVAGVLAPPYTLVPAATPAVLRINMPLAAGVASYLLTPATTTNTLRQRKLVAAVPSAAYALTPAATTNLTKLANNVISVSPPGSYALTPATTTNLQRRLPLVAGIATYLLSGQPALTKRLRMTNAGPSPPYLLVPGATPAQVLHKWKVFATPAASYALAGDAVTVAKGGAQPVEPPLYNDPDTFFTHTISIIQSLNPELFEDPDTFFTHVLEFDQFLTPNLFLDPDIFGAATVFTYYGDTEVIDVPVEDRCMVLEREDREMIQPPEDRNMEVLDEETMMYASPRKRRA